MILSLDVGIKLFLQKKEYSIHYIFKVGLGPELFPGRARVRVNSQVGLVKTLGSLK